MSVQVKVVSVFNLCYVLQVFVLLALYSDAEHWKYCFTLDTLYLSANKLFHSAGGWNKSSGFY